MTGQSSGYSKTHEVLVNDFQDKYVEGIPAGEGMKFKVPETYAIALPRNVNEKISDMVRVEDALPGEPFTVARSGRVKISFRTTPEFRALNPTVQSQYLCIVIYHG
jgi:hypothetical protein